MASVLQKPDGLTVVDPDQVESFLSPLLVDQLVGVGTKTKGKMETLGIRTIGDLAKFDMERLIRVFGKKLGIYFHNSAMGVDEEPVRERGETESVSRISTLKEDTRELAVIVDKVNPLCNEIYEEIKQKGVSFKSVGITAVMADMSIHSRSKTLDNRVQDLGTFKNTVKELFEKLLAESEIDVRRVGVKISSLFREKGKQEQLESFIDSMDE
jgi:DNA polymerase IV (DinB-like DNA polymerase)